MVPCLNAKTTMQYSRNMRNLGKRTPPKENKFPVIDPPKMEIHDLLDKEFKIVVLKKFNELLKIAQKNNPMKLEIVLEQNERINRDREHRKFWNY